MAELAVVSAVATIGLQLFDVVTKLHNYLQDAKTDLDIKEDVERLNKELLYMQSFLKDAENRTGGNTNLFQTWVADVRELVISSQDFVDKLFLITLEEPKTHNKCLNLRAMSCCYISSDKTDLHSTTELSCQLKKLLSDIHDVSSRRARYDPTADVGNTSGVKSEDGNLIKLRRSAPYANKENVVGLDETIEHLTTKLLDGDSGSFLISIVGMGGLGKTTLARKLYNAVSPKYFESRAWVCVSKEYNTQDIFKSLINSIIKPSKEEREFLTDISSMEAYLREYLSRCRFLVVIDDVWEREAWESLERAFPDNNNGSKVIITTRNEKVAALNNAYVHRLRYLEKDESWELFCIKALPPGTKCPSNLIQVGEEMVAKCSNLPLAIVILGGILLKKSLTFSKWRDVRDNLWKELEKDSIHIDAVLTLSFKDLPYHLKQCFLYVAMFPEDYEIRILQIMMLWEAEGFITADEEGCAGDGAKSYFDELVGRSLFSITGEDRTGGTFRVHDLLRDLAIRKAREIGFSLYYDGTRKSDISKATSHTRLAVFHPQNGIPVGYANSLLHTLCVGKVSMYDDDPCPSSLIPFHELFPKLHEKFVNLRVLDIQEPIESVPKTIGMLIHLRYLGLTFSFHVDGELPDTIGNLKALQNLSIESDKKAVALPDTVLKLTHLKHLIGRFRLLSDNIGSLVCLESLGVIYSEQWCRLDTTKLVNLRYLCLSLKDIEEVGELCLRGFYDNFKNLVKLQTLALYGTEIDHSLISLEKIFEMCPSISHLETNGVSFHNSLGLDRFAVNLEVLEIYFPVRNDDAIIAIGKLPQLEALILFVDTESGPICFKEGFDQLRSLDIYSFGSIRVTVMEGCMPLLEHLVVVEPSQFQGPDRLMRLVKAAEGGT